jgi:ribosomal protein S18 acetylase RimI-like enzyme
MSIVIREMTTQDYDEVFALWRTSEGVGLSDADSEEDVTRFLARNPGLCFVARDGEHLVGAVLCGHDGRLISITWLSASPIAAKGLAETLWGDACPPSDEMGLASATSLSSPTIKTPSLSGKASDGHSGLN